MNLIHTNVNSGANEFKVESEELHFEDGEMGQEDIVYCKRP